MSMRKITLAPGQLLRSVHMEKSYLGKAGYPGQRKTHVNSYRRQTVHRVKVDPWVSELPGGNELSRDHMNRPLEVTKLVPHDTFSTSGEKFRKKLPYIFQVDPRY